jgi:SNF2 family DNA or RNA helicase
MANFMVLHQKCLNLSDMGTGKTLSTLWAADYVMEENPGMRCLIVCPLSITQRVWADAIVTHFMGKRTYRIIEGTPVKRRKLLAEPADFYIINYEGTCVGVTRNNRGHITLGGLANDIANRKDIGIVAIDEARAYSNDSTRRHRVARATLVQKPYLWCLTGTPLSNGPLDAHGIARLVNNAHGESKTAFRQRIEYQVGPYKWLPKRGAVEEAYRLLQPAIRFEMRDCIDVPPCTETMRDVELSDEQKKSYANLKRDLVLDLGKGTRITTAHEAALRLKLIQISCGAIYDSGHEVTKLDCTPRLAVLREVIEEAKRKVIIFTPLTSVLHILYEELKEYSRAIINGQVSMKLRNEIFDRFQNAQDPQVIIADPGCMAHGLNLFAASVVVWFGATDRAELYLQGNKRIDRPGQTVPTTIVQLAATPEEREIYRRIANNQSMQGLMLDMVKDQRNVRQQCYPDTGGHDRQVPGVNGVHHGRNDPLGGQPQALPGSRGSYPGFNQGGTAAPGLAKL